jgi:hypothetical protein
LGFTDSDEATFRKEPSTFLSEKKKGHPLVALPEDEYVNPQSNPSLQIGTGRPEISRNQ